MIDVKLDKFQGPLSLLLQIIEKEEMDITSVNLTKIADEYLEYIKNSPDILPESMADFLLMAARLLYIKSRALLPYLLSEDDDDIDDLSNKLKMYKEFVDLSHVLQAIIGKKKFSFFRDLPKNKKSWAFASDSFFAPKNVDSNVLHSEFKNLLEKVNVLEEKLDERLIIPEISIEDRIVYIKQIVSQKIRISFTKIINEAKSRTEVVVNFLAVLELSKQREIDFVQDELFGEIFLQEFKY